MLSVRVAVLTLVSAESSMSSASAPLPVIVSSPVIWSTRPASLPTCTVFFTAALPASMAVCPETVFTVTVSSPSPVLIDVVPR